MDNDIKLFKELLKIDGIDPSGPLRSEREAFDKILDRQLKSEESKPDIVRFKIWRTIMNSKMIKLAAAVVIIFAVFIGISYFGNPIGTTSAAFGEVLGYLQKNSYTFNLIFEEVDKPFIMRAKVWELGRMRIDCNVGPGVGRVSIITDLNTNSSVILFHQNKTAVMRERPVFDGVLGTEDLASLCSRPISELWNVCDGLEEEVGKKVIDGRDVTGYRLYQKDEFFDYEMTIWVLSDSGIPYLVETITNPLEESYPPFKWTMENFDLDAVLEEGSFSLDIPEDYTLAYQENLDDLEVKMKETAEAKKIVQMIELSHQNKLKDAADILLSVDWSKPVKFGKEPYIFSITEKGYVALKTEDQKRVSEEIFSKSAGAIRKTANEMVETGKSFVEANEYEKAEKYFNAVLNFGHLLDRNPNAMVIVRLIGMSVEKLAIKEMVKLYVLTGEDQKLEKVQNRFKGIEAETKKIKEQASLKGT